jgi:hypothetical protein
LFIFIFRELRNIYKLFFVIISMVEKDVTKKWLVLLIVLVALSLVVDLLSLNVLYSIGKESSDPGAGELFSEYRDCFDGCMEGSQYDCVDTCEYGSNKECNQCEQDVRDGCRSSCH